jgi:hypothetical protein
MEKIDLLLEELEYRIPVALGKKIDNLDALKESFVDAQEEYNNNPTDEAKETLVESKEYIDGLEEEILEQLELLIDKKRNDAKTKEVEAQKKDTEAKKETPKEEVKEEKKESSGVLGLVIGAVLLVGSLGAINYFKNNR